ncbi:hypothetical protein D9M70_528280 [compost metagenome]
MKNERYIVKPEDIKDDIQGFPIEVVQWMVDEQVRQGGKADVDVFRLNRRYGNNSIAWSNTQEGFDFCDRVIALRDFDLFFDMYPKAGDVPFVIPGNTSTPPPLKPLYSNANSGLFHRGDDKLVPILDKREDEIREQRLYETAKAAMQGLLANPAAKPDWISGHSVSELCELSILTAKELLRQLEKEIKTEREI